MAFDTPQPTRGSDILCPHTPTHPDPTQPRSRTSIPIEFLIPQPGKRPPLVREDHLGLGSVCAFEAGLLKVRWLDGQSTWVDPKVTSLRLLSVELRCVEGGSIRPAVTSHRRKPVPPAPSPLSSRTIQLVDGWDYQQRHTQNTRRNDEDAGPDYARDDRENEVHAHTQHFGTEWIAQAPETINEHGEPTSGVVPTVVPVEQIDIPKPQRGLRHLSHLERLALKYVALRTRGHNRAAMCDELGVSLKRLEEIRKYVLRRAPGALKFACKQERDPETKRFTKGVAADKTSEAADTRMDSED